MLQQSGEAAALRCKAEVLAFTLLRSAIAEMIEEEDSSAS